MIIYPTPESLEHHPVVPCDQWLIARTELLKCGTRSTPSGAICPGFLSYLSNYLLQNVQHRVNWIVNSVSFANRTDSR